MTTENTETKLPAPGTKVKCLDNRDRPELVVGQVYTVAYQDFLDKMPINPNRYMPDDFRFIAIEMPSQKEHGIFPAGIFVKA